MPNVGVQPPPKAVGWNNRLALSAPLASHSLSILASCTNAALSISCLLCFAALGAVGTKYAVAIVELVGGLQLPAD